MVSKSLPYKKRSAFTLLLPCNKPNALIRYTKGFYIYRKVNGSYKKIGSAKASATSFKETLKTKGSYSYKMRAYNGTGNKISYSAYTAVKTVKIK